LEQLYHRIGFPGATVAFVLPNGDVGDLAVGMANQETREVMTPAHRMPYASIGKSLTASIALILAGEGRLDLDEPIVDLPYEIPWWYRLPNADTLTVRHLLTHTSGLPDHVHLPQFAHEVSLRWAEEENPFPTETLVGFVLDRPPLFPAGEGWAYSDTGYVVLGDLLRRIAGRSVYDEVEDRFLWPLGLTSVLPADQRGLPGLASGYTTPDHPFGFPSRSTDANGHLQWHPAIENFGGGWIGTARDLARWGHARFTGDALPEAARVEARKTLPMADISGAPRYGAGVSLRMDQVWGPVWGHGGWIPGYVGSLRYYEAQQITVAFLVNTDSPDHGEERDWVAEMEASLIRSLMEVLTDEKTNLPHE
jgi:D-alanyl-D-alanine carboxypeptidase